MIKIITFEEYKERIELPKTQDALAQKIHIEKQIADATNIIDNFCAGKVFIEYPLLDPVEDDYRIQKLKWAIIETTRLLSVTGKNWYNLSQSVSSQVSTSVNWSSTDSNLEINRQDIIASLVAGKWYKNIRAFGRQDDNQTPADNQLDIQRQAQLDATYLRVDGANKFTGNMTPALQLMSSAIHNAGDIYSDSSTNNAGANRRIVGYTLEGSVERAELADLSLTSNKILDPLATQTANSSASVFKYINEFDISYWGGATTSEIQNWIKLAFRALVWRPEINYEIGTVVLFVNSKNFSEHYESLVNDNLGHNPETSPSFWKELQDTPIDMSEVVRQVMLEVDPKLDNIKNVVIPTEVKAEVKKQLDELPSIDQIIYHAGEIVEFFDENSLLAFTNKYDLRERHDFTRQVSRVLDIGTTESLTGTRYNGKAILVKAWDDIKPSLTPSGSGYKFDATNSIGANAKILSQKLIGDKISDYPVEGTSIWGFYNDKRSNKNEFYIGTGYVDSNSKLGLMVEYYDGFIPPPLKSPVLFPFITIMLSRDVVVKATINVGEPTPPMEEHHEIFISDNPTPYTADRMINLYDFGTDKTQRIVVENNGVLSTVVPLNYSFNENENWTGDYFVSPEFSSTKQILCFNKYVNDQITPNSTYMLECLYDCESIVDIHFVIQELNNNIKHIVYPSYGSGLELYYDERNGGWTLKNNTTKTITGFTISIKYTSTRSE